MNWPVLKKRGILLTLITVLGVFFVYPQRAYAMPVSPDKYFINVKAGETQTNYISVYGPSDLEGTQKIYLTVMGMRKVGDQDGREFYFASKDDLAEPANWITLEKSELSMKAGLTEKVKWTITPTNLAGCGTNLAAIIVSNTPITEDPTTGQSQIGIGGNIASQIHLNVTSSPTADCSSNKVSLQLKEFKLKDNVQVYTYDHISFTTKIANNGNIISRKPTGFIELFGFGEKITIPFNDEGLDIYPKTDRVFENIWIDSQYPANGNFFDKLKYEISHLRIGKYEARLGVTRNATPQIVATTSLWIIPWRVLVMLLSFVLSGFFVGSGIKLIKRKRNRVKPTMSEQFVNPVPPPQFPVLQ